MLMTIINYNSCNDVDIMFEDGVVVKHKKYDCFLNGKVKHPRGRADKLVSRIGETNTASNGLEMKIVAYRESRDIDVMFSDGKMAYNRRYDHFLNGSIRPDLALCRIGEENVAANGLRMKIVAYRNYNSIDVLFEDGTLVENKSYDRFEEGYISHPSIPIQTYNSGCFKSCA